jgi:uracil-DNA glycosylase
MVGTRTAPDKAVASTGQGAMLPAMSDRPSSIDPAEAASLLGWWIEAGVDTAVTEEPRNWLEARPRAAPTSRAEVVVRPGPDGGQTSEARSPASRDMSSAARTGESLPSATSDLPATLEAFHAWLRESGDLPLFRAGAARALPHGPAEAEIMLVLGPPSAEDAEGKRPLGGEAWTLATRMLAAIGLSADQAYVAALTCFPSPLSRLGPADADQCAKGIRRHIALVAPRRLLVMGGAASLAVLGEPMGKARGRVHRVEGARCVATFNPRHLLDRPADKVHAWRDLLLMMDQTP